MTRTLLGPLLKLSVLLGLLLQPACGAPQVPPGPDPEYQRPQLEPWDAPTPVDPLAAAEDGGEWVDDEPSGAAGAGP